MTSPHFPDEPSYWLRRLFESVDGIDKKLDIHAEKLASQEVRLVAVESEVATLRAVAEGVGAREVAVEALSNRVSAIEDDDKADKVRIRANITFAITTLIAIAGVLVALFG